jgi:hypothetical protein
MSQAVIGLDHKLNVLPLFTSEEPKRTISKIICKHVLILFNPSAWYKKKSDTQPTRKCSEMKYAYYS